jgi:dipeptidyl aminopeptidase/acylaminoacyl peptidase
MAAPTAVAVVVYEDAGYRLHVADLSRAQLTPIGPEREVAHQPVWSPDGTQLAYRVGDELLVHRDGAPRDATVAAGVELEAARACAFSPDGRGLAIALRGGLAVAAITPGTAEIAPAAPLASYPGHQIRDLRWSPDGATLVALVGAASDAATPRDAARLAWIPMTGGAARIVEAPGTVRLLGWRSGRELLTVETSEGRERVVSTPAPGKPGGAPIALAPDDGSELSVLDYAEGPDRVLLVRAGDPDDDTTLLLASPGGATVPWLAAHPRLSELQLTSDGTWAVFIDRASGGERPGGSVYVVRVGSEDARLVLPASPARSFSAPVPRPSP